MAFAKSQEVREAAPIEKFLGSTIAHLEFVNPTKEELAKIGINLDKEKVYVSDTKVIDVNGKESNGTQNALEFWYSFDFEGEKKYVAYKVWISNSAYIGSRTGKIQVCDHYGRFACWLGHDRRCTWIRVQRLFTCRMLRPINSGYRRRIYHRVHRKRGFPSTKRCNRPSQARTCRRLR